jgi:hypothetical protein
MAIRPVAGYPLQVGDKYWHVFDIDGPASYVNSGTFNTSGQQINIADLGFGGFDYVEIDGLSSDGVNGFSVVLGATVAGALALTPTPGAGQSGPAFTTFVLHWYTTASNATEVSNATNLSTKSARIRAVCV